LSFFKYCEELLEYYKFNDDVFSITGSNFQDGIRRSEYSYYFSKYSYVWGWATWRRAWKKYDYDLIQLENFKTKNKITKVFTDKQTQLFWINQLENAKNIDTWDYQWSFALWDNNGISITPNINLTKNIGFGPNATHTTNSDNKISKFQINSIGKIIHTNKIVVNQEADNYTFNNYYSGLKKEMLIKRLIKFILSLKYKIL
jgi:hypothetical protein